MIKYKIKSAKDMTIEELIGQVIMVGLPFDHLDDNYTDSVQMKVFMKELYNYTLSITGSFPLVSIDQEGGMVVRLFKDVTFPASPLTTSATIVPNAPRVTGKIIGTDMLKHGLSINLAPCLQSSPRFNRGMRGNISFVYQVKAATVYLLTFTITHVSVSQVPSYPLPAENIAEHQGAL